MKCMNGPISSQSFSIMINNQTFLKNFGISLFWFTHTSLFHSEDLETIQNFKTKLSKDWCGFYYPFEIRFKQYHQNVRDHLHSCIPYFYTQVIQSIYIYISDGDPLTIDRNFRTSICIFLVKLFTGIVPLDSLVMSRLAHFFKKPPQAMKNKKQIISDTSVKLPKEDLDTLIDLYHRTRAKNEIWTLSGVSPLIANATKNIFIPYEHEAYLEVQFPPNGISDWTTNLPPLLPPPKEEKEITDVKDYNPMDETRSLILRSRRPMTVKDHEEQVLQYQKNCKENEKRKAKITQDKLSMQMKVRMVPPDILNKWLCDLRKKHEEKKFGDTPDFEDEIHKPDNDSIHLIQLPSEKVALKNDIEEYHPPEIPKFPVFYLSDVAVGPRPLSITQKKPSSPKPQFSSRSNRSQISDI